MYIYFQTSLASLKTYQNVNQIMFRKYTANNASIDKFLIASSVLLNAKLYCTSDSIRKPFTIDFVYVKEK